MPIPEPASLDDLVDHARANDGELPFSGKFTHLTGRFESDFTKISMRNLIISALILGLIAVGFGVYAFDLSADVRIRHEGQPLLDYLETSSVPPVDAEFLMTQQIATCTLSANETATNSVEIVAVAWNSESQAYGLTPLGTLTDKDNLVIYQLANLSDWYYIDTLPSANMRFAFILSEDNLTCTAL